jgi:competence CoiA-like predicted nuclease
MVFFQGYSFFRKQSTTWKREYTATIHKLFGLVSAQNGKGAVISGETDHLSVLLHWHIRNKIKSNRKQKKRTYQQNYYLLTHPNEVYKIRNLHTAISKFPNVSQSVTSGLSFLQIDAIWGYLIRRQ